MDLKWLALVLCSILVMGLVKGGLIGTLPNEQHQISGNFYIVNTATLFIEDFNYDGAGPGAFLYSYAPGVAVNRFGGGTIIPLPASAGQGSSDNYPGAFQRRRYTNEDIMVTLPAGVDACDIGTITIWCQPFTAIFTRLAVPEDTFANDGNDPCTVVNPGGPNDVGVPDFDNCKVLHSTLQLSWRVDNDNSQVRFRLCGCTAADPSTIQYLGFGLSGSTSQTFMFGADATITWVDGNGMAQAQDYYLSNYVQCRSGRGACPDTVDTTVGGCTNDVSDVSGVVDAGQQCISFTRPFTPTDAGTCDRAIDPTNQNQYIVWGIGSLGVTAFQHHTRAQMSDSPIHLGREPMDECADIQLSCQQCDPFPRNRFIVREDATFMAEIGPSANPRGYTAITGQPGWGIAWYLNQTLVPELVVERGRTYTFIVYGGNNAADDSNYHPFYISNLQSGGRLLNSQEERMAEIVYAGFDGSDTVTAVGPLCEYSETAQSEIIRQGCDSYDNYIASLTRQCQTGVGEPSELIWRPDESTPSLVYYQCAAHLNLGRGIQVINQGDPVPPPLGTTDAGASTPTPSSTTDAGASTPPPSSTTDAGASTPPPSSTTDAGTSTPPPLGTTDAGTSTPPPLGTTDAGASAISASILLVTIFSVLLVLLSTIL